MGRDCGVLGRFPWREWPVGAASGVDLTAEKGPGGGALRGLTLPVYQAIASEILILVKAD
jgi:hypothetical protein